LASGAYIGHVPSELEQCGFLRLMFSAAMPIASTDMFLRGDGMRSKILFWLAVVVVAMGAHSSDGDLFYFFAVYLTTLMIGFFLFQREKRGRTPAVAASSDKGRPVRAKGRAA
jgi:hypothetical protein